MGLPKGGAPEGWDGFFVLIVCIFFIVFFCDFLLFGFFFL